MSLIKIALVAASLIVAATVANAGSREELATGYHGNTPVSRTLFAAPRVTPHIAVSPATHGAFARGGSRSHR